MFFSLVALPPSPLSGQATKKNFFCGFPNQNDILILTTWSAIQVLIAHRQLLIASSAPHCTIIHRTNYTKWPNMQIVNPFYNACQSWWTPICAISIPHWRTERHWVCSEESLERAGWLVALDLWVVWRRGHSFSLLQLHSPLVFNQNQEVVRLSIQGNKHKVWHSFTNRDLY